MTDLDAGPWFVWYTGPGKEKIPIKERKMAEKEDQEPEASASVSCKVRLETYQKLSYFAMKRSMQSGSKQTLSRVAGEVLDKAVEQLDSPPDELLK